jgi:hypothetical protein
LTVVRQAYLRAVDVARELLADPAVAASWHRPSALPEFAVSGLAGHLARQVVHVAEVLALPPPAEPPIALVDHVMGAPWLGAGPDDEVSVRARSGGEAQAADGAVALVAQVDAVAASLREALRAEPADRVVRLPWSPWSLSLDDFLVTRMLEIAVHCDDLAVSVGVDTPALPPSVLDPVLSLLVQLAARRHGPVAVLRALSRAERAPATIAAI